ncbi:ABC transporter substrate-binding protein [Zavarzinia compransoris]|uniref:Iron ABC transporter substrate-binding protein n=1 Tax=Zavarzinia compransoris TaxID=1264899 RepID=A0A317E632_9PROT|nr:ABC transporter substrate-binding protein [Zavarzinia compransoris]PWR20485.1 iron ABC transporter substrate-binding protein [Zavarzinia compransoris]TDP43870.1 iron complex transport system substrate-binding protein [Zavarzinia compransoris]
MTILRLLGFASALVLALAGPPAVARDTGDATGRILAVPDTVARVFAAGPPAGLILYSLAPDRLLGWPRPLAPESLALLPADAAKPAYGRLTGKGDEANLETILKLKPDLIVDVGSIGPTYVSLATRVQEQTGVPVLLFDGRLDALAATYRRLGGILGLAAEAEIRAAWIESRLARVRDRLRDLPPERRPRVYFARGPEGLETARAGSINVEAIDYAGGRNVAGEALGGGSLVTVSLEQVLAFDPDIIIAMEPAFHAALNGDPLWRQLRAVGVGRAVLAPQSPFPWVDYPPSVNRVLGVLWLAALFHPDLFPEDLRAEVRDFHRLFYHRTPSETELDALLAAAAWP